MEKTGFKNEAEGYAASLRQQADWHDNNSGESLALDTDELRAAADFIDRQQAEIDRLRAAGQGAP